MNSFGFLEMMISKSVHFIGSSLSFLFFFFLLFPSTVMGSVAYVFSPKIFNLKYKDQITLSSPAYVVWSFRVEMDSNHTLKDYIY